MVWTMQRILAGFLWVAGYAAAQVPEVYQAPRGRVKIDGRLNESIWKKAPWTPDFRDIATAAPAPVKARAKMAWDARYFYLAVEIEAKHLWSKYTDHDAEIFRDPCIELFLDPEGDGLDYFEWQTNIAGVTWDLKLSKPYKLGGKADSTWEIPGLKKAIALRGTLNNPADTDEGWTLEAAFPWTAFGKTAPKPGESWRVTMSHVTWSHEVRDGAYVKADRQGGNFYLWSPHGDKDMHRPDRFGRVVFQAK
jgi:hypothetical protein